MNRPSSWAARFLKKLDSKPAIIQMSIHLWRSGKTTFPKAGPHAEEQEEQKPLLVACDVYRPAAIEQLARTG